MKKILLFLGLSFITLCGYSQAYRGSLFTVQKYNTAFGMTLPSYTLVLCIDSSKIYELTTNALSTGSLSTTTNAVLPPYGYSTQTYAIDSLDYYSVTGINDSTFILCNRSGYRCDTVVISGSGGASGDSDTLWQKVIVSRPRKADTTIYDADNLYGITDDSCIYKNYHGIQTLDTSMVIRNYSPFYAEAGSVIKKVKSGSLFNLSGASFTSDNNILGYADYVDSSYYGDFINCDKSALGGYTNFNFEANNIDVPNLPAAGVSYTRGSIYCRNVNANILVRELLKSDNRTALSFYLCDKVVANLNRVSVSTNGHGIALYYCNYAEIDFNYITGASGYYGIYCYNTYANLKGDYLNSLSSDGGDTKLLLNINRMGTVITGCDDEIFNNGFITDLTTYRTTHFVKGGVVQRFTIGLNGTPIGIYDNVRYNNNRFSWSGYGVSKVYSGNNDIDIMSNAYMPPYCTLYGGRTTFTGKYSFDITGSSAGIIVQDSAYLKYDADTKMNTKTTTAGGGAGVINQTGGTVELTADIVNNWKWGTVSSLGYVANTMFEYSGGVLVVDGALLLKNDTSARSQFITNTTTMDSICFINITTNAHDSELTRAKIQVDSIKITAATNPTSITFNYNGNGDTTFTTNENASIIAIATALVDSINNGTQKDIHITAVDNSNGTFNISSDYAGIGYTVICGANCSRYYIQFNSKTIHDRCGGQYIMNDVIRKTYMRR